MRGSHLPHAKFSLQSIKYSLRYAMGIMFGMFSFAFGNLVPKNVKQLISLSLSQLACMPGHSDTCIHVCDVHARQDITRFTNKVNHVIMTSSAFTFHLCHIGMRWHDVIGVHIA